MSVAISDLRAQPAFAEAVADRIWRAWWEPQGTPRDAIVGLVHDSLSARALPLALVAHQDGVFIGTASVIASDLAERPDLTPWVAAVWVEPVFRRRGVAAALVGRAADAAFGLGVPTVYLCARPALADFYGRLGWGLIEQGVGPRGLSVFTRQAPGMGHR